MKKLLIGLILAAVLMFGCVEFGDGWVKIGQQTKYACPDGTTAASKDLCKTTPANTSSGLNGTTPEGTTKACDSDPILNAITSNLLTKSNTCRQTRVTVLCSKCSTCCDGSGHDKTEYAQSIDPTCYSCAATNFGVARARDYYDRMGAYENKCAENCPDLVDAYKAFLQYGKDKNCELPEGWKVCTDVTLG